MMMETQTTVAENQQVAHPTGGSTPSVSVLILTYNEEKHIARCIESVQAFCNHIYIIDSFSTDRTVAIAERMGAQVLQRKWENNHAQQFNWGLAQVNLTTDWVMRLDADEYVLPELAAEIRQELAAVPKEVSGINLNRRVMFLGRWIKHGGYYPTTLLRIWRSGSGMLEQRWMDEHVKLEWGSTVQFKNDIVDHNLNNLTWWTAKHNNYAFREVIDFLNHKYGFSEGNNLDGSMKGAQDKRKRWLKEKIYFNTPLFVRPFAYFIFRYFIKLGFLDGKQGIIWHFLQGFWYRFLVDAKVYEVYHKAGKEKTAVRQYLEKEYGVRL